MASPGNRRCANRIGALLFSVNEYLDCTQNKLEHVGYSDPA